MLLFEAEPGRRHAAEETAEEVGQVGRRGTSLVELRRDQQARVRQSSGLRSGGARV